MKRKSQVTTERVRLNRQNRFNPIRGLTPKKLASSLDDFWAGNLRPFAVLADAMMRRDPILRTVTAKRFKSPARCPWEILTVNNTPRAKEHAAALRWFYNNIRVTSAHEPNERGGFALLVRQILTAVAMKYAVHELVLRPRRADGAELPLDGKDETAGSFKPDTLVTAEFRFCPLWWFEARKGPLAYLPDDWAVDGEELRDGEWMITVADGLMECCSVAYTYKHMGLHDWVSYNEKYGSPFPLGKTTGTPDSAQWKAMEEAVASINNDFAAVCSQGDSIEFLRAGDGQSVPYDPLVDKMDAYMTTVWRGGDLGTLSGNKPGDNTGASLQGDETNLLTEDDCALATETLNAQIDPLVIRYLFGEEPLAYVQIIAPKQTNLDATIRGAEFLQKQKVPVGVNQLRERMGWPVPAKDEPLLGNTEDPAAVPQSDEEKAQKALENEAEFDANARELLAQAVAAALQALLKRIAEANEIVDPQVRIAALTAVLADYDQLQKDLLVENPVAAALLQIQAASLVNGIEDRPKLP